MCFNLSERCCSGKMLNRERVQRAGCEEQASSAQSLLPLPSPADVAVTATTMELFAVPDCLPFLCPKGIRAGISCSWFKLLSADLNGCFGGQDPSNRVVIGSSPSPPQQSCWRVLHQATPVLSSTAAGISAELLWVSGNHMPKCYAACSWGVSYHLENVNSVPTVTTESFLV